MAARLLVWLMVMAAAAALLVWLMLAVPPVTWPPVGSWFTPTRTCAQACDRLPSPMRATPAARTRKAGASSAVAPTLRLPRPLVVSATAT